MTDTDALATLRDFIALPFQDRWGRVETEAKDALDSLAAEMKSWQESYRALHKQWAAAEDELERVRAERDEWKENAEVWNGAEEDLAKALSALREIAEDSEPNHYSRLQGIARDRLAEIEGEA